MSKIRSLVAEGGGDGRPPWRARTCESDRVWPFGTLSLPLEWLSPLLALLHTRDARGGLARATLARAQGSLFFQLNVCDSLNVGGAAPDSIVRERVVNPPLGWQLSRLARNWVDSSLTAGPSNGAAGASDSSYTTGAPCRARNVAELNAIAAMMPARQPGVQR